MTENHANKTIDLDDPADGVGPLRHALGDLPFEESSGYEGADRSQSARTATSSGAALQRAQVRRSQLHDALVGLERTAAHPTDSARWLPGVQASVSELVLSLEAHMSEVEGANGLLARILDESPRLAAEIAGIRDEHVLLADSVETLNRVIANGDTGRIRRKVTSLLGRIALHRQRGADLVYEAYNVDIGASG
jgi:hypothetical protein